MSAPRPYGNSARAYLAAGYWPLPLPPRKKASPPEGYTGRNGRRPGAADVGRWVSEHRSGNIGLRLPPGVAGIDVDAYKDEEHVAAWEELFARYGPLPAAPWCSSRDDGVSGVRLFAVPENWEAAGKLPEGSNGVSPGEVIQWHHRYVVCPPSIHPDTGRAYRWRAGSITKVADLPALPKSWLDALAAAAAPAERPARPAPAPQSNGQAGLRPGDDFNERGDWLYDILVPHGWTLHHESGGTLYVTRPGKNKHEGHSATIGHSKDDKDRLYVFSADAAPFEVEKPYDKFAAWALLNHGGNHKAAARELGRMGYGSRQQSAIPGRPADRALHVADDPKGHDDPSETGHDDQFEHHPGPAPEAQPDHAPAELQSLADPDAQFNADAPLQFMEEAAAETDAGKRGELAISAVEGMLAAWPGEAVVIRFRQFVKAENLMMVGEFNDLVKEAKRARKRSEKFSSTPGDISGHAVLTVQERPPCVPAFGAPVRGIVAGDISGRLEATRSVYTKWLGEEYDLGVSDVALSAAASAKLGGDPPWVQVVGGSGAAKTETIIPLRGANAVLASTISGEAGLLSATSEKDRAKDATGGLLRAIGSNGVLVIKDFTSILSMNRDTRALVLAALREIYDGHWDRNVGTDGGQTIKWDGRLVLIGACTTAWDSAHQVIAMMGDRFLLVRLNSRENRLAAGRKAMGNVDLERLMRAELAEAVGDLMAGVDGSREYTLAEKDDAGLLALADIVTRARTAVERDFQGNPAFAHDLEMPTRLAKQLVQVARGGLALGMERDDALATAERAARDSMPPLRQRVLTDVSGNSWTLTSEVVERLQLPRKTVDRTLQELHLLGLLVVRSNTLNRWEYMVAADVDAEALDRLARNVTPPVEEKNDDNSEERKSA
jgi:hypothetical protein